MKAEETGAALLLGGVVVTGVIIAARTAKAKPAGPIPVDYVMHAGETWAIALSLGAGSGGGFRPFAPADEALFRKEMVGLADVLTVVPGPPGPAAQELALRLRYLKDATLRRGATIPWGSGSATIVAAKMEKPAP